MVRATQLSGGSSMTRSFALCTLAFVSLASAAVHAQKAAPPGDNVSALADNIVVNVAAVKEGEVVFVGGDTEDMARLLDIYLAVQKQGGLAMLRVSDRDTFRKYFAVVPAKYDRNAALL